MVNACVALDACVCSSRQPSCIVVWMQGDESRTINECENFSKLSAPWKVQTVIHACG